MLRLLCFALAFSLASTQNVDIQDSNAFEEPWAPGPNKDYSDNRSYKEGVHLTFAWKTRVTDAKMTLLQDNLPNDPLGGPSVTVATGIDGISWEWTITYAGIDPTPNNVYYLSLDSRATGGDIVNSHYFNISSGVDSSTSSSTPAATQSSSSISSTSSTISTSTPATIAPPGPTVTIIQQAGGNSGLKAGTIAGIAIGVVVGAVLLIGAGWWAWRSKKKRNTALENDNVGQDDKPSRHEIGGTPIKPIQHEIDGTQTYEAVGSPGSRVFELPTR